MEPISASRFVYALRRIQPKAKQLQFLREHFRAKGRALTARRLAGRVGYKTHGGVNLWYGRLARQIAEELSIKTGGASPTWISLLVDLVGRGEVTNREYVLVMRPEFADALKRSKWV